MAYDDDSDSTGAIPDHDSDADDRSQQAAAMPTIPGNQSNTPGPYVPSQPQPQRQAAAMPTIPGNQSNTPGPYVPSQPQPQRQAANDSTSLIQQALAAVQDTVQYTRKKYGLDDGSARQAAAMPTIPGNQSNTPGPYVPQQPPPQQVGAIPEEDDQEAA